MSESLATNERARLEAWEASIRAGLQTFHEVGAALIGIRDERLYRETHATFEEYCRDRWNMKRAHAYRLMEAAETVASLSPNGDTPLPSNEGQARALAAFEPDMRPAIMEHAKRLSDETGKPVTAGFIERVGGVFEEAKLTGHVDIGDGTSTPLDAALAVEAFEQMQRQKERIRSHYEQHEANGHRKPDAPKPHVAHNSGDNEWYTPPEYLEAARRVMGSIDLDPASSAIANERVQAALFFTAEDDGLARAWGGRVWMNPPYAGELIGRFCEKLAQHFEDGTVSEAIVLVNNATETRWFQRLAEMSSCVAFPRGRVRFLDPEGNPGAPLQGQAVIYLGPNTEHFAAVFSEFGFTR